MTKVEAVCPHCKKTNAVEKSSFVDAHGIQIIQCSHCSKTWARDLSVTGSLTKSAPGASSDLAELRVQVRAQLNELTKRINGLIESRVAAR